MRPPSWPRPRRTGPAQRALLRPLVRDGEIIGRESLAAARDRHRRALAELPVYALQLSRGYPAIPTLFRPDNENASGLGASHPARASAPAGRQTPASQRQLATEARAAGENVRR